MLDSKANVYLILVRLGLPSFLYATFQLLSPNPMHVVKSFVHNHELFQLFCQYHKRLNKMYEWELGIA